MWYDNVNLGRVNFSIVHHFCNLWFVPWLYSIVVDLIVLWLDYLLCLFYLWEILLVAAIKFSFPNMLLLLTIPSLLHSFCFTTFPSTPLLHTRLLIILIYFVRTIYFLKFSRSPSYLNVVIPINLSESLHFMVIITTFMGLSYLVHSGHINRRSVAWIFGDVVGYDCNLFCDSCWKVGRHELDVYSASLAATGCFYQYSENE